MKMKRSLSCAPILTTVLLLLIALCLRFYKILSIPPSIFIDEYNLSLAALKLNLGLEKLPIYGISWYGTPAFFIYYLAGIFRLFGTNRLSIKLAWLLPSFLTVPLTYILAKKLFDKKTALYSLLLISTSVIQIHLSRWGHGAIIVPTLFLATLYAFLKYEEKQKIRYFLLATCFLALSFYTYVGGRVFVIFFLVLSLGKLIVSLKTRSLLKQISHLILFWLIFLILISPLLFYGIKHSNEFLGRTKELLVFNSKLSLSSNINLLLTNMKKYFLMFFYLQDPNPRHNPINTTPFSLPTNILFLLGFVFLILKKRFKILVLFLLWSIVILSGGFLTTPPESPSIFRTATIIPLVYLASAFSISTIEDFLNKKGHFDKKLIAVAIFLFLAVHSLINLNNYFAFFNQERPRILSAFTKKEQVIAELAKDYFLKNYQVSLDSNFYWLSSTQFEILSQVKHIPYKVYQPNDFFNHPYFSQDQVIILDSNQYHLKSYFQKLAPKASFKKITLHDNQSIFIVEIPKNTFLRNYYENR